MNKHWIMDVTRAEVAGRVIFVSAVVDAESREIIATDTGTIAGSAVGGAFGGAVFAHGAPDSLAIDNGRDFAVVVREAAKLGVEVRIVPPYNATSKGACERAMRSLEVNGYRFPVKGR